MVKKADNISVIIIKKRNKTCSVMPDKFNCRMFFICRDSRLLVVIKLMICPCHLTRFILCQWKHKDSTKCILQASISENRWEHCGNFYFVIISVFKWYSETQKKADIFALSYQCKFWIPLVVACAFHMWVEDAVIRRINAPSYVTSTWEECEENHSY